MSRGHVVLAFVFLSTLSHLARAQTPDFPAGTGQGRKAIEALLQSSGLDVDGSSLPGTEPRHPQSFVVRWEAGQAGTAWIAVPAGAPSPSGRFTFADRRSASGPLPRQRLPQLSPERLLVAAVGSSGQLQSWTLIQDPRLLRSELPDARGELRNRLFYRSTTEFSVTLAVAPDVTELQVYQPRWNGREFTLEPLASIALPGGDPR